MKIFKTLTRILTIVAFLLVPAQLFAQDDIRDPVESDGGGYSEGGDFGIFSTVGEGATGFSFNGDFGLMTGSKYYFGYVVGGTVLDTDGVDNVDIDETTETERLYVSWSGFTPVDTTISSYEIAVGNGIQSDSERTFFIDWTNVGAVDSHEIALTVEEDELYYVSVRAVTFDNIVSAPITSDGVSLSAEEVEVELEDFKINGKKPEDGEIIEDSGEGITIKGKATEADEIFLYLYDEDGNLALSMSLPMKNKRFDYEGSLGVPDGTYTFQIIAKQDDGREIILFSTIYIKQEGGLGGMVEEEEPVPGPENLLAATISAIATFFGRVSDVADDPVLEEINEEVVIPVLTGGLIAEGAAIVALVATTSGGFAISEFIVFVRYLSLLPFGYFKKRKYWGLVYDYSTGERLPFVQLKLINAESEEIVDRYITDATGRYGFIAADGEYRIEVEKRSYSLVKDGGSKDHYAGQVFGVREDSPITFDLRLMNMENAAEKKRDWRGAIETVAYYFMVISIAVSLISIIITPSLFNIVMGLIYLLGIVVINDLSRAIDERNRTNWIIDTVTRKGVPFVTIRIFDRENALKDIAITDHEGKFGAVVDLREKIANVIKRGYSFPSVKSTQETAISGGMIVLDHKDHNEILVDKR